MIGLEKTFEPSRFEESWYARWLELGVFTARVSSTRPAFSMVIPPPNITGRLHMGHALNNTLQDILARWHRMKGEDVLWLPGTDHAGIATQMVVDRSLVAEGTSREALGREAFVARVWRWKEEYGGTIVSQLKRLGCSCDWTRERFTLEPALSSAVREAFVRLYEDGLIYRDKYIVNWCPRCRTAISDLEVIPEETHGRLYTIAYPYTDGGGSIQVATTRPETMLGDTGVAVHPDDRRYRDRVGRNVLLPLVGRSIPVVADPFVDREFGTGAVKVTPAHDANDYQAAQRTGLPALVVMDEDGRMNGNVPERYRGLDRFEARRRVVEDLEAGGHLVSVQDHLHNVGHCQRCHTVVEPYLSTQWFVRAKPLAEVAVAAVAKGRVRFTPAHWVNSYNEWMEKIHDWCISRQLWWGHQIPAWHCDACGGVTVAREAPGTCSACGKAAPRQDPDVLDTWFSSALWPFSTLGWPERTPDLARYYPTSVLVTGFDILFFWVARMLMMGLKFMEEVPFSDLYVTGMVRDAAGQKMSKTRGNVIDPLVQIDRYGADALRFTLAAMATPGADLPLAEERMAGYRAFANKIWNAARFVMLNLGDPAEQEGLAPVPPRDRLVLADRWILSRLSHLTAAVDSSLGLFRFDEAANALYQFLWHEYCDWYLEVSKPALTAGAPAATTARTRAVLLHVLEQVLRLLHPIMPFLTEEIWQKLPRHGETITLAPYPRPDPEFVDEEAEDRFSLLMDVVGRVRNIRAELNIDPGRRLRLMYHPRDQRARETLAANLETLVTLGRLQGADETGDLDDIGPAARAVARGVDLAIVLAGIVDVETERRRLGREIEKLTRENETHARKLRNPDFLQKARPEVVDKAQRFHRELQDRIDRLVSTAKSLR
jgi:valyl-tRNA synthetase